MFFGWEGVGLCSYLLIGFWYDRSRIGLNAAAIKAFLVNRVGDFGFALGIIWLFCHSSAAVNFDTVFASACRTRSITTFAVPWHMRWTC